MPYWSRRIGKLMMALGLLVVAGCYRSQEGPNKAEMAPTDVPAPSPRPAPARIVIDNFTFDPPTLTVPAGTEVTWINRDDVPHTATSSTKPRHFDSGALDSDERFSHVFNAPGVYDYFCAVHPKMIGQIIVK